MTDRAETWVAGLATTREHHHPENLSDLLVRLARTTDRKVTIRDIAIALQDRSFGAFLLVFALPNLVPLPRAAPSSWGCRSSSLPGRWRCRRVAASSFRVSCPIMASSHRPSRRSSSASCPGCAGKKLVIPRFWLFESRFAERLIGVLALILAIVVFLPIPLGNWPPAFALAVLGFAHSQRDGLGVLAGCVIGILSLIIAGFVVYTAVAVVSLVV